MSSKTLVVCVKEFSKSLISKKDILEVKYNFGSRNKDDEEFLLKFLSGEMRRIYGMHFKLNFQKTTGIPKVEIKRNNSFRNEVFLRRKVLDASKLLRNYCSNN